MGGRCALPSLKATSSGVGFASDDNGSLLDISSITSFASGASFFAIGGEIRLNASVTSLDGASITDFGGIFPLGQLTSLTNGSLTEASGVVSLPNLSDITGSSLSAQFGGGLTLPSITSFDPNSQYTTFSATGNGSVLSLPALTSVTSSTYGGSLKLNASDGGQVLVSALTTVDTASFFSSFSASADGAGSTVDLSGLTQFNAYNSSLSITNSGTVLVNGSVINLDGVSITLDGTGTFPIDQFVSLTDGGLTVEGGSYDLFNLTDIDGSSLTAENGGNLTLHAISSFEPKGRSVQFSATGDASTIFLPVLTTEATNSDYGSFSLNASGGGHVLLSALTSIDTAAYYTSFSASADGMGSIVNLSNVTTYNASSQNFTATNEGAILFNSAVTSLNNASLTLDATGAFPIAQITSLTNGSFTLEGGSLDLVNLTDITGSSLTNNGGGDLTLPSITTFDPDGRYVSFSAANDGSVINLPSMATVTTSTFDGSLNLSANNGGQVLLPALTTLDTAAFDSSFSASADGTGSTIDLSGLTTFNSNAPRLSDTNNATFFLNASATSLDGLSITVDGTGTLSLDQFTSITDGSLTVEGGSYDLANLTDIDGTNLRVSGGGSLTLPSIASFDPNGRGVTFSATDSGSLLSLPALTMVGTTSYDGSLNLDANGGGQVLLPALTTVNTASFYTSFSASANGQDSTIDLTGLTALDATNTSLSILNSGAILMNATGTSLDGVSVTVDGTGNFPLDQFTSLADGSLTIEGGTYDLANLANINGSTLSVSGGGSLTLPSITTFDPQGRYVSFSATDSGSETQPAGPHLSRNDQL